VRFVFIDAEKANYPVRILCHVLEVSRSGFYAWQGRSVSEREKADAKLAVEIAAVHKQSRGTYGSPRIHVELRENGTRVGRKRVARLMRDKGLQGRRKRRFRRTTDSNHSNPVAPNLLDRRFEANAPDQVWVTDVTCFWTDEGWVFLAALVDLFARRVVGWATSATNDTALALDALRNALRERDPGPGLLHHSDRGSPYTSAEYRRVLDERGIVASMSRKGDCWDNAVAESFWATVKVELDDETSATRAAAEAAITDYIDSFYNSRRRHSSIGYATPIEFELKAQIAALAA